MTLTVTNVGFPYPIGAGFEIDVQTDLVGPIANDDYFVVNLRRHSSSAILSSSTTRANGQHTRACLLNIDRDFPGQVPWSPRSGAAAGEAVDLEVTLYHSNLFTVVDGPLTVATTYDPFTALSNVIQLSSNSADLTSILNAVVRQFPPP